eukprot:Ihof_evm4s28 gene=Ihof_evmTU4s28
MSKNIPPNHTVYVRNINEKVKKEELRRSLYGLFSQYGPILDVIALKTPKCRGQAWVAFKDVSAASKSMFGLQGFVFYDRPLKLYYSTNKSNSVARMDGTFGKKAVVPAKEKKKAVSGEAVEAKEITATVPAVKPAVVHKKQ